MQYDSNRFFRLAVILVAACALNTGLAVGAEEQAAATVAVVNGEVITIRDLEKRLETLHGAVDETQRSSASLERLLFKLVNDVLIGQEARALGLHEEEPVPKTIEKNRRRLARSILERQEIKQLSQPEDHEVTELFDQRYRRASFHVLTGADRAAAEAILDGLREGVDIETLALEKSIDPYQETGGLLEGIARKDLQLAIADVVFNLAPNEVAGPVETDLGWSVLVARDFEPPDPELFEKARPTLVRLVRQRKETTVRQKLLESLRASHEVTLDQGLIDAIQPVRRPDGRLTAKSPGPDTVVARIGDEITVSGNEYALALEERWKTIPDESAAIAAAPIILENLLNDRLFLAEAYRRGYQDLPAVQRVLYGLETDLVIPTYLSSVLASGVEVTEDEKRAHYEEIRESLRRPPRVRLGQITVATPEEAEVVARALRGGTDLAWLAERHSTDGLRGKGGIQDWSVVQPDGSPLNTAFLEADLGSTLDPVQQEESWVVYKVLAREDRGVYSYDEVSGNMREAVFKREFTAALDHFIQTARSRSRIEVNEDVLAALQLSGSQESEQHDHPESGSGHGAHGVD